MTVAVYIAGIVFGCCVIWLVLASTGLGRMHSHNRDELELSWRRVWLPALASAAAAASFFIIRFVGVEAPVSPSVVIRGWLGFFFVFAAVFAASAALMMAVMRRATRFSRNKGKHQPSAR